MQHALSPTLILVLGCLGAALAGCADHDDRQAYAYSSGWGSQSGKTVALKPGSGSITTGALPLSASGKEKQSEDFHFSREQMLRHERRVYAQGLEKILASNGISMSVMVYEGQVGPSPTLMFFGHFTKEFVARALTSGAVLQRAKELGFTSVDFFDRGPEGHYQFVVSKTGPLPKCAAYQRLCL